MDETRFWSLIDEARNAVAGSDDALQDQLDALQARLEDLEPAEVAAFQGLVAAAARRAYTYPLSGALYVLSDGSCDDIDFLGFRGWLIAQGKERFEAAVEDPDSLASANLIPDELFLADMLDLAANIHRDMTGTELPAEATTYNLDELSGAALGVEELPERLPQLCSEYAFSAE